MRARKASVWHDPRNPSRPWVARWLEHTEDGRKVRRGEAFTRQRDAERFANRKTRELRGEVPPAEPTSEPGGLGDTPLGVFIDEYLERRKADGIRPATLNMYRDNLGRLRGCFGDGLAVAALTTDGLAKFIAGQRIKAGKREGQPLAKSSRNGIVRDLDTMFSHAVAWGYVATSPMAGIKMLKVGDDDRRGWHYFSPADIQGVLREATTLRDRAAIATLYGTGLRFGELFSLHPDDVDTETGYVHVKPREATNNTPPFRIKDHERRSIPLPKSVGEWVMKLKAALADGHPYLFLSPERCRSVAVRWRALCASGKRETWQNRLLVNNAVRRLRGYATRAGLSLNGPVTVHALRKSYGRNGARCLPADVLKAYMGHSKIETTLTFYSKRDADDDTRARWVLDAMLSGDPMPVLGLSDVQSAVLADSEQRQVG